MGHLMSIKIQCSGCQQTLKVKDTLAGKLIRCPSCQAHCRVPAAELPAPPQMTPEAVAPPKPEFAKSQIGRFQIRAALGQGGFGTVYRAWDPILNREVALKVPRGAGKAGERLILEARAAAPLHHPNIVAVYEAGADGDDLFIATEYVEGQTLVDRISGKAVDSSLAAEWVKSLAEALEYAHREGVIHRDVKPHNAPPGAMHAPHPEAPATIGPSRCGRWPTKNSRPRWTPSTEKSSICRSAHPGRIWRVSDSTPVVPIRRETSSCGMWQTVICWQVTSRSDCMTGRQAKSCENG